jgi:hypothetical protein
MVVLHRVGQKVQQRLLQQLGINADQPARRLDLTKRDGHAPFLGKSTHKLDAGANSGGRIQRLGSDVHEPAFDAAQVQHFLHEAKLLSPAINDLTGGTGQLL